MDRGIHPASSVLEANQINSADRTVRGIVQGLRFRDAESGYFVAQVQVPGISEAQTVVGHAPSIAEGEQLEAAGRWVKSKYGPRFKANTVQLSLPVDKAGLIKYLSGALKGIGPGYARKLVDAFGTDLATVLEKTPQRISEVPGIGPKRAAAILEAWRGRSEHSDLLAWLCGLGLSLGFAQKVHRKYGDETRQVITENPYRLAEEVAGIGFLKADAIGKGLGLVPSNPHRVAAALLHLMREATDNGSCGLPRREILGKALALLGFEACTERTEQLSQALGQLCGTGVLIEDRAKGEACVFLRSIYETEREIAERLVWRLRTPVANPIANLDMTVFEAELEMGLLLEERQREAVRNALLENVAVITGGPGTGKTTITRAVVQSLRDQGFVVQVCAPTGKAAKRAAEAIGVPAMTIHRTLEWKATGPSRDEGNPLACDALVVDELSMVDVSLFVTLLRALPAHARLILVGDADQLPSVGPGKVLSDLIASRIVPTTRLTEVFRQAAQSRIIVSAHLVNLGKAPPQEWRDGEDFGFLVHEEIEDAREALLRAARDIWKHGYDPVKDVQVLAPMRKGRLGTEELNTELQRILNPAPEVSLPFHGATLGVGDKVIQTRNNYDKSVFNGEVGFVTEILPSERKIVVDFDDRVLCYERDELSDLRMAYALTIHRMQGSEFPVILMGLAWQHYMMLKRNLLYTGITRARKLMLIFGHPRAVAKAARDSQIAERYSKLQDWLTTVSRVRDVRGPIGEDFLPIDATFFPDRW